MSSVDFGRYKRMVRYFWDPQPKNDDGSSIPIWCLGKRYISYPRAQPRGVTSSPTAPDLNGETSPICDEDRTWQIHSTHSIELGPDVGHFDAQGHNDESDREWPKDFLDDFESRIWFTYRSGFPAIKKSLGTTSSNSKSLSAFLRGQLGDQEGFTSDTGWGCMIRSGQSLLANTIMILRLGRGRKH